MKSPIDARWAEAVVLPQDMFERDLHIDTLKVKQRNFH